MTPLSKFQFALAVGSSMLAVTAPVHAADGARWDDGIGSYVGIDTRLFNVGGTFAGLVNPNANRLTFLFDHGDHFHGIGSYSLTGTAAAPVVMATNVNNRIPEPYTRVSPATSAIPLGNTGTGDYAGHWVSGVLGADEPTYGYSHLGIASIQSLDGLDGMNGLGDVLFHSSGNRWSAAFQGVTVGLKLVNATAGLMVGFGDSLNVFGSSQPYALGNSGNFESLPIFYVANTAAAGTYSAEFQLVNLGNNGNVRDSGSFFIDFSVAQPVPEPQTWAMLLAGLGMLVLLARKRRRAD